jgi:PhnB protein
MATTINPYIAFDGNCEQAVKFWAEVLGAELDIRRMGDGPMPIPPEAKNRVMHATVKAGPLLLMASDGMPGQTVEKGGPISLSLNFASRDEQSRVWERLAQGGAVVMPLEEQFWGRFGMVKDKFGIQWMLNLDAGKR